MKNAKISRRSFLKAGAVASAVGMLSAAPVAVHAAEADASAAADEENGLLDVFKKPKYVFLFIGDGMGTAQIQSARFYKGTVDNNGAVTEADLSFTSFPQVGSVTTYDSTSFCPDSASTATSIATGHKTESGVINMCPWTRDVPYETIAEKLHAQKGYKVGVISTVNIDHATPAAFYAHQKTRKNYYQIGVELANSGFEYFAGGEFQKVNGDGTGPDNHTVAANAGYNVVTTQAGAAALTAGAGKTLIIAENLGDGKAMNYAMDAANGEWQLTDYVKKGIELLNNKKGFFLMTESGKIDWACHAGCEERLWPDLAHRPRCRQRRQAAADRLRGGEPAQGLRAHPAGGLLQPEQDEPAGLRAVRHLHPLQHGCLPHHQPQVRYGSHHLRPHRCHGQRVRHGCRCREVRRCIRQHRDLPQAG